MKVKSVNFEDAVLRAPTFVKKPTIILGNKDCKNHEKEEKPNGETNRITLYFAGLYFMLSFIFVEFTNLKNINWINGLIMLGYLGVSFIYVLMHKKKINKVNRILFIAMLISCIPLAYYENNGLKVLNLIFTNSLLIYWLLSCCGHLSEGKEGNWILFDLFSAIIFVPFAYMKKSIAFLLNSSIWIVNLKIIFKVGIGFILSLPLLMIIVPLLFSADPEFKRIFSKLFSNFDLILHLCSTLVCACPIFLYYFSSSYANTCYKISLVERKHKVENNLKQLSFLSNTIVTTMEVILCITYVIFLIATCISIYTNIYATSINFSYSQYARSGFFELCTIAVLNFGIIMLVEILNKRKHSFINRVAKNILSLETICITLTAIFRLGMYMHVYRLTHLRVYSMWLMLVLLGIFVIMFIHTFKKGNEILHIVSYVCACFLLLILMNVDRTIERVNEHMDTRNNILQVANGHSMKSNDEI